jgi:hypothetical protein
LIGDHHEEIRRSVLESVSVNVRMRTAVLGVPQIQDGP